ncbi:MAG: HAMP domain-containing histidine kinase [Proteobacteria bacterium]|nr:HAMP domain-containing histidine kinase [Pseudomonadota bacterium]
MSLKSIDKLTEKIGFKMASWYSGLMISSMIILFLIAYFFLSSTLENRDSQEIQSEISELETEYNNGGLEGIRVFVDSHLSSRLKHLLFIRIADNHNHTLYQFCPFSQDRFDIASLEKMILIDGRWLELKDKENRFELDILTRFLSPDRVLQLGIDSQLRENDLGHFRQLFLMGVIPLILTGIIFGVFLSVRALKPIRHIIDTVAAIDIGKMDSRVPRTGTGDELDELARLFNDMLDKINHLIKGMKNSLDNVAHDLRTPLTRMRNICESSLYALPEDSSARTAYESILEESERILQMLNTLMDISEAETGVMALNKQENRLKELIFPIYDLYQVVAESRDIKLSLDIPDTLVLIADPHRISQAIANLLDNAVKFSPEKGSVHIDAINRNDKVIIRIQDQGLGIADHDIEHIWDRLYRGDQSRSQKGLGLGLSLVKAIVQAHGGDITVSSQPGKGSLFTISLPRGIDRA